MLPVSTKEICRTILREHAIQENPPTFLFPCLNGRQQRELLQIKEDLDKGNELEKFDGIFVAVASHLSGWENIDFEYGKVKLNEVISYIQAIDLLALLVYQRPSVADKKKSKLPLPSDTENSVKPAKGATSASESSTIKPAGDATE